MIDKDKVKALGFEILDSLKAQNPLYDNLKSNFPQTIDADGKPNLKAIATLLGLSNKADMQGYELTFSGKGLANALYSTPCAKELKLECVCHSKALDEVSLKNLSHQDSYVEAAFTDEAKGKLHDLSLKDKPSNTKNTIIRGDNLDVLKLLKSAYSEKIKMIYIDPPYNTKNDNFIYPDDFRKDYQEILKEVGLLQENEKGEWIESESLKFFKNITGSKSHSGWLSFMLPRLKLARDLLREDGVIFISIDDNEQANLKILCDEIFGEENFIETFLWNKTQTPPSASNKTRKTHEFILCYQKVKDNQKMIARFAEGGDAPLWNETNSERILQFPTNYVFSNLPNGIYKKGLRDKIELLDDAEIKNGKIVNSFRLKGHFRWKQETLNNEINNDVYLVVKSDKFSIRYCRNSERIVMPTNEISKKDNVGTNETASSELENLMNANAKVFSFNKPISLIKYLLKISTSPNNANNEAFMGGGGMPHSLETQKEQDIILDFFAGSGTTAHAVMELNAEDGGNRQFILVQIDEPINEKNKIAYDFCKNELKSKNPAISDITIERVKRAGAKIAKENPNFKGDLGFSVYSLCDKPSLICDEDGHLKLLTKREGASPSDIARSLALQCGKELDKSLECILESKLYKCEDVYCVVQCDKEVLEILAKTKNEYILIDGYADINLEPFLNLKSSANIDERLRVIY